MFCIDECCIYEELRPYTALSCNRDCAELGASRCLYSPRCRERCGSQKSKPQCPGPKGEEHQAPPPMLLVYVHLFERYDGLRAHPFGLTESYFWSARIILSEDVTPSMGV